MSGLFGSLTDAARKRKAYNRMVAEITSLTDRELNDIGIHRSHAPQIAKEAIYGK